jgi:hypothetical protein
MTRYMSSGLILMTSYTVLLMLGAVMAWGIGLWVEASFPGSSVLSLSVFLGMLALIILGAAPLALLMTPADPKQPNPIG